MGPDYRRASMRTRGLSFDLQILWAAAFVFHQRASPGFFLLFPSLIGCFSTFPYPEEVEIR